MKKKRVTTRTLMKYKRTGRKIVMVTAYDYPLAKYADEVGIDVLLVGDSLGMVVQGQDSTLPVTLEDIIYHSKIVARAAKRALVVADMPFLSYQVSVEDAVRNCGRVMKETGVQAVKVEGGEEVVEVVEALTRWGIPVMGHIGLTPQKIHRYGGYRIQGRTESERARLLKEAKMLEEAGIFSLVLEAVPYELAKEITESLSVPTIGIGAGPYTDGQVLVIHDLLGFYEEIQPRFVKRYAELAKIIREALQAFQQEVLEGKFPTLDHSYRLEEFEQRQEDS